VRECRLLLFSSLAATLLTRDTIQTRSGGKEEFCAIRTDGFPLGIFHAIHAKDLLAGHALHHVVLAEQVSAERAFDGIVEKKLFLTNRALYRHSLLQSKGGSSVRKRPQAARSTACFNGRLFFFYFNTSDAEMEAF
jgi:hypothetical protein